MKKVVIAGLVVMGMLAVPALAFEELAVGDAHIKDNNNSPDGTGYQHCVATAGQTKAMIVEWDLSAYAGWDAVGDATLTISVGWADQNPAPIAAYELIGGDFDETTVTGVSYAGGDVSSVFGDLAGSGLVTETGNFTYADITIAQASMDKLLKGTADGLALTNVSGTGMNMCIKTKDADWTLHAEPTLTFDAVVPEPATMSLLALGGLAALIRRK